MFFFAVPSSVRWPAYVLHEMGISLDLECWTRHYLSELASLCAAGYRPGHAPSPAAATESVYRWKGQAPSSIDEAVELVEAVFGMRPRWISMDSEHIVHSDVQSPPP